MLDYMHIETYILKCLYQLLVFIVLCLGFIHSREFEKMNPTTIQSESQYRQLAERNEKIVIQCNAPWNRHLDQFWHEFGSFAKDFSDVAYFNLDVDENENLALDLGVKDVPAYLFCRNGEVVGRYHGSSQTEVMERMALLSAGQPLPTLETPRPFRPSQSEDRGRQGGKPLILFVAGDRSKVGKSSCCLGLLGSLLKLGYNPADLAYIKPATQCEQPQLVTRYCDQKGITNRGIGPVVFYKGFTREFLKGNVGSSKELLDEIQTAVAEIGKGKKFVLVDGVGYPAVGSICGISNADITAKLGVPVLVVGPRGVGNAVDSFNLNACFFESVGTRVLGAVYNRLSLDKKDYYSMDKTREAVDSYFQQYQPLKTVYGYIPEIPNLGDARSKSESQAEADEELMSLAVTLVDAFSEHVDVERLVEDMRALQQEDAQKLKRPSPSQTFKVTKRPLALDQDQPKKKLSRLEIEKQAKAQGAKGG